MEKTLPSITTAPITYKIRHIPVKRLFDIFFSLAVLIFGFPIFLFIALTVYLSSKGNVIYHHERVGRGGKSFRCYKFRTMFPDADKKLGSLLETNPSYKEEWNQKFKLKSDPRITPIGAFLRRTSLDELPQFWNVLKGDLSVVGPRPVVQEEIDKFFGVKAYRILSIRPGLTGIWQISGRSNTCYRRRLKLDEKYVKHQSFALDLKIIAKTIPTVFLAKGS